ncbi:S8 family peptidase [Candidatus Enterococcus mansonii]|nr:S8/S53 family peptidase [Enterococcus sp. 4G2_DIV0659]
MIALKVKNERAMVKTVSDYKNLAVSEKKRIVKIGVIDGEIDKEHIAFSDLYSIKKRYFSDNITDSDITHGTSVLGVICGNNDLGIGDSRYLEVMNAVILSDGLASSGNLKQAIEWCIEQEVEVINVSVAFTIFRKELLEIINSDKAKNILFIFSNGNFDTQKRILKKEVNNMIFVGATDSNGNKAYMNSNSNADVYFQGIDIMTAIGENKFQNMKGTTYSTAIATGLSVKKLQSTKSREENQVKYLKNFIFSQSTIHGE